MVIQAGQVRAKYGDQLRISFSIFSLQSCILSLFAGVAQC